MAHEKIEEIYRLSRNRLKEYKIRFTIGMSLIVVALASGIVSSKFSVEGQPFWVQSPIVQFTFIVCMLSFIASFLVAMKVKVVSFEKKIF